VRTWPRRLLCLFVFVHTHEIRCTAKTELIAGGRDRTADFAYLCGMDFIRMQALRCPLLLACGEVLSSRWKRNAPVT
jgi:hypothetical protein